MSISPEPELSAELVRPYRKRPVLIEAALVTEQNQIHVAEWCHGTCVLHEHILIHTLEGVMQADLGDYVIRGIKGEFYPCKPDIFEASYEDMSPEHIDGYQDGAE